MLDLNDPVSEVRVGALGRLPLPIEGVERLGLRHDEPQLALWRRRHGVRILVEAGELRCVPPFVPMRYKLRPLGGGRCHRQEESAS